MSNRRSAPAGFLVPLAGARRKILALALFLALLGTLGAQGASAGGSALPDSGSIDLVLLIDDSASVLQWSRDLDAYLLGPFVRDYLRLGDTVHLLSFGSSTSLDFVRKLTDEADLKAILGQLFLLYPIQRHTDFIGALDFLSSYVKSLDPARKKLIVIVTDGVQDPAPGSRWAALDVRGVKAEIDRAATALRGSGWPVRFVILPFGSDEPTTATAAESRTGPASSVAASHPAATSPSPAASASGAPVASGAGKGQQPQSPKSGGGISAADEAAQALDAAVTRWPPEGGQGTISTASSSGASTASNSGPSTAINGAPPSGSSLVAASDFGIPSLRFPGDLGQKGRTFTLPLRIDNKGSKPLDLELVSVSSPAGELIVKPVKARVAPGASITLNPRIRLPESIVQGTVSLPVELGFADDLRTMPGGGTLNLRLVESPLVSLLAMPTFLTALGIIVFFIIALVIIRLLGWLPFWTKGKARKALGRVVSSAPVDAAAKQGAAFRANTTLGVRASIKDGEAEKPKASVSMNGGKQKTGFEGKLGTRAEIPGLVRIPEQPKTQEQGPEYFPTIAPGIKRKGQVRIEFRVLEQNSHVGKRNVHELREGQALSVGGKHSDFLIFLVPMPHAVAELHFDGEACSFVPRDRRLFPALKGPISSCLDRDIPMVSPRGYPLTLRFSTWEDPGLRLNRLLHCIEVPGLDWDRGAANVPESREDNSQ